LALKELSSSLSVGRFRTRRAGLPRTAAATKPAGIARTGTKPLCCQCLAGYGHFPDGLVIVRTFRGGSACPDCHHWSSEGGILPRGRRRSVATEIAVLRRTLRGLDRSLRRLGAMLVAGISSGAASRQRSAPRRPRLSAKARAALKLQGRYMGYVRQLKMGQKARVKNLRKTRGVRAAIVSARKLLGRD
jgi:hypothetical protein